MLQEGEDGSDQVREQQVPPASVEEQLWELWLGGGVDALEATISKFDEKFAAATLHYGGTSLRIVGLATRMRISKTIRTADIDGTSENNRALVVDDYKKLDFWALVDISGRAYLVEAHDSGVGNFVRLSAGYRLELNCLSFSRVHRARGYACRLPMFDLVSIASSSRMFEFLVCPSRERLRLAAGVPRRMDKFQLLNIRDALFSDPLIFNRASFLRTKASAGESSELPARLVVEGGMDEMYGDPLDAATGNSGNPRFQDRQALPPSRRHSLFAGPGQYSRYCPEQLCCMPRLDTFLLCGQALSNNTTRNIASANEFLASICNNPFLDIVAIHDLPFFLSLYIRLTLQRIRLVPTSVISLVPTSVILSR
ncbi:hypothetical protein B0H14DRAFT_2604309 [Mycena olivaceomarginata]|nr:hypothetical protein B0H14DRAFT_2604309 [Mycena olivaceomarginata]